MKCYCPECYELERFGPPARPIDREYYDPPVEDEDTEEEENEDGG